MAPEEFVHLWGTGQTVDMPVKLGLEETLMVVSIENVPQEEKARAGGHKRGKGKLHTRMRKFKHTNGLKQNMFIIFLFLALF